MEWPKAMKNKSSPLGAKRKGFRPFVHLLMQSNGTTAHHIEERV